MKIRVCSNCKKQKWSRSRVDSWTCRPCHKKFGTLTDKKKVRKTFFKKVQVDTPPKEKKKKGRKH